MLLLVTHTCISKATDSEHRPALCMRLTKISLEGVRRDVYARSQKQFCGFLS